MDGDTDLYTNPSDVRGEVRDAASEAVSVLSKASDASRNHMFPSLLHYLENPAPASIPLIKEGI
jgi:hypothetical protein